MNVRPTLICFFFLSLQDGSPVNVYPRTEGDDMSILFSFSSSGNTRFFCKNECKEGDLIETTNDTAQSGRYGIEYETVEPKAYVSVRISQLTKSDSGRYRCGLGRSLSPASYVDFEVVVVDAQLYINPGEGKTFYKRNGDNLLVECYFLLPGSRKYFCKEQCEDKDILVQTTNVSARRDRYSIRYVKGSPGGFVLVNISQLTRSDSGLYRCGLNTSFSPDPYRQFRIVVTDGVLLYWVLTLVIIVTISVLALTIICIQRKYKPNGSTRGNSDGVNLEFPQVAPDVSYENCPPVFTLEDSTYQSIDPASRDQDQSYSTISEIQRS